jgi:hypothetical protein
MGRAGVIDDTSICTRGEVLRNEIQSCQDGKVRGWAGITSELQAEKRLRGGVHG